LVISRTIVDLESTRLFLFLKGLRAQNRQGVLHMATLVKDCYGIESGKLKVMDTTLVMDFGFGSGSSLRLPLLKEEEKTYCLLCNMEVRRKAGTGSSGPDPEPESRASVRILCEMLQMEHLSPKLESQTLDMEPGIHLGFCSACQAQLKSVKAAEEMLKDLVAMVGVPKMKQEVAETFMRSRDRGWAHDENMARDFPRLTQIRKNIASRKNSQQVVIINNLLIYISKVPNFGIYRAEAQWENGHCCCCFIQ
jgi:hypothetical protein